MYVYIVLVILSRRNTSFYAIFHSGSLFTSFGFYMVMGCILIQEVKGLTKRLYFILLTRRNTSLCAKFQVHCLPVFRWLRPALSGLSVKQEAKRLTTNYTSNSCL